MAVSAAYRELKSLEAAARKRVKYARIRAEELRLEAAGLQQTARTLEAKAREFDERADADREFCRGWDFDPCAADGTHDV